MTPASEVLELEEYKSDLDNCYSEQREQTAERRVCSNEDRRLNLDRRRGPGRRRTDDRRAAEEGQMTDEQFGFVMAVDQYKKQNSKPFPSWTEVLEIVKALGYRKVAEPCAISDLQKTDPQETEE
jgi:hypothetical protein